VRTDIPRPARDDRSGSKPGAEDHVLGPDGRFHVADEAVRLSVYAWEDWGTLAVFWILALVVFYQVFTRYVLNDAAGWTEEIARYLLIAVTFLGGAMAVRRGTHIQVDFLYRFIPRATGRVMSTFVDAVRIGFFGYAVWLTWLLIDRIGTQRMAVVELPIGLVFGAMLIGFALMLGRSVQVARQHWRQGYSVLERPEFAHGDSA
jgi:TRAP-type transport system small permease protein